MNDQQQQEERKAEEQKREEQKREEQKRQDEKQREEQKQQEERKAEEQKREEGKREERKEKRERQPYVFEEEQQQVRRQVQPSRPRAKPAKQQQQDRGGPRQGDDELQMALSMDHPGLSDAQKSTLVHMGYKSNSAFDQREAERKGSAAKTDHAKPAARQTYEFANEKDQGRPDMQR